jgi:hypothetical protein
LIRGDANGHGVLVVDARSLAVRAILREFTSALESKPDIARPVASVDCAASDPKRTLAANFAVMHNAAF